MAYIVERYNRYEAWDRDHAKYVFNVNESWYAIKEVELEWGKPILPEYVEESRDAESWQVYDTFEDALQFVHLMKGLNAR